MGKGRGRASEFAKTSAASSPEIVFFSISKLARALIWFRLRFSFCRWGWWSLGRRSGRGLWTHFVGSDCRGRRDSEQLAVKFGELRGRKEPHRSEAGRRQPDNAEEAAEPCRPG